MGRDKTRRLIREAKLAALLFTGLLPACGTSAKDTGGSPSDGAQACTAFGAPACARGKTCCLTSTSGTCTELSACPSIAQFECQGPMGCAAGETCCASIPYDQTVDASGALPAGGLVALGIPATSFCSSTCSAPSLALCASSVDCARGAACTGLPEGSLVLILLGAETLGVCAPLDAGARSDGPEGANSASDSSAPTGD